MKGTVRAAVGADIDDIGELPDAGRAFNRQVGTHEERLETLERQLAALGDVSTTKTTKEQKLAPVVHFATNKRGAQSETVAVTADEIDTYCKPTRNSLGLIPVFAEGFPHFDTATPVGNGIKMI